MRDYFVDWFAWLWQKLLGQESRQRKYRQTLQRSGYTAAVIENDGESSIQFSLNALAFHTKKKKQNCSIHRYLVNRAKSTLK